MLCVLFMIDDFLRDGISMFLCFYVRLGIGCVCFLKVLEVGSGNEGSDGVM